MSWTSDRAVGAMGSRAVPAPAGRCGAHAAVTAVLAALAYAVVAVPAYFIAGPSGSVTTYVVLQTGVGLVVLVAAVRWCTVSGLRHGVPAVPWTAAGAAAAYLLVPSAWTGSALFWWRLLDAGPLTFLLDLPVWGAVVALGVLWGASQQPLVSRPVTPYG